MNKTCRHIFKIFFKITKFLPNKAILRDQNDQKSMVAQNFGFMNQTWGSGSKPKYIHKMGTLLHWRTSEQISDPPNMTLPVGEVKELNLQREILGNFAYPNLISEGRGKLRFLCEFHSEGREVYVWYPNNPLFPRSSFPQE